MGNINRKHGRSAPAIVVNYRVRMTAPPVAPALREAIDNPQRIKGVGRHSPVAGLDRRSVGFVDVLAQSVSAVAPSAASTTVPVMVAATAGSTTVWAIGAAMLLCMIVASTVNQFARRISSTGSLYTFVAKGLGPAAGSVTGVAMLVGYGFIAMFSLTGASLYLTFLLGKFWPEATSSGLVVSILIVAISGLCFVVLACSEVCISEQILRVEVGGIEAHRALQVRTKTNLFGLVIS